MEPKVSDPEGGVFEIRIYSFNIGGLSSYLKMMDQHLWQLRASFSTVMGPWKTEINSLCEVAYIAHYDSLAQLLDTRQKMNKHPEWSQNVHKMAELQMSFKNYLTILRPETELQRTFTPSECAVYELQTMPESEDKAEEHGEGTTVVGRFLSVYGPSKTEFRLLRYADASSALNSAIKGRASLPAGSDSRLMVPLEVSNMK